MKKKRCHRCKHFFPKNQLIEWLDDMGDLSPHFCRACYAWIVEHWEEGQQLVDLDVGAEDYEGAE